VRVLQIVNSPDPGGVLALANEVGSALRLNGLRVTTIFLAPEVDVSKIAKLRGAFRAGRRLLGGGFDTVIAYQAAPAIIVGLAGLFCPGIQRIVHQTTVPRATAGPLRLLDRIFGTLGLYTANIVNTGFTRDEFAAYPAAYRRRLILIEHGVPKPAVIQSREETLGQHAIPNDRRIILATARLVAQKNLKLLVRVLPDLPDARLIIAGDGNLRHHLERLARDLGVNDRLHLLGPLTHRDTAQLYGAADIFAFPSLHETFGISAVEAVIMGLPTIVSDIVVLKEVLRIDAASPVAFLPPTDAAVWAGAIGKWLDTPPPIQVREQFATAMALKYSPDRMAQSYLSLVRSAR
jgi:glycosyltransferase involved in cell wall biosynthesis